MATHHITFSYGSDIPEIILQVRHIQILRIPFGCLLVGLVTPSLTSYTLIFEIYLPIENLNRKCDMLVQRIAATLGRTVSASRESILQSTLKETPEYYEHQDEECYPIQQRQIQLHDYSGRQKHSFRSTDLYSCNA